MPTIPAARRLSPRVRRLLQEHRIHHRAVPGTGAGGRVTARDVLDAAGVARPAIDGGVLASPLARRRLRDAGIELAAAMDATGGGRLTSADAARLVADSPGTAPPSRRAAPAAPRRAPQTVEREVDVARLQAVVATAQQAFVAHNGFELDIALPVARALVTLLRGRALPTTAGTVRDSGTPRVHLGVLRGPGDPASIATVADAQDLCVAGLARRSRTAAVAGRAGGDGELVPTFVVATDEVVRVGDVVHATSGIGLLAVHRPHLRTVRAVDRLGCAVTRERPHAVLRLSHDDRLGTEDAAALLDALGDAITSWSLPMGP